MKLSDKQNLKSIARKVSKQSLDSYASINMKEYGTYTIKHRAVCDFRDGLKPVQRRVVWAAYQMNLKANGPTKKTARLSGDVIGKYHPHGMASVDDAITNLIGNPETSMGNNCPQPILHGQGNFGPINKKAAGSRYTELRLNKYAEAVMLAEAYINGNVTDLVPNFDGDLTEPVVLPALLPHAILNGTTGIAVGVTAGIPAFEPKGVMHLLQMTLKGETITAKLCHKHLRPKFTYNEQILNSDELLNFYKTGQGNLKLGPTYEISGKKMIITGGPPSFNAEKAIERINKENSVASVMNFADRKNPINIVVTLKSKSDSEDSRETLRKIASLLSQTIPLRMNLLESIYDPSKVFDDDDVTFHTNWSMPKFFEKWTKWRVELEQRAQQNIINELTADIFRLETLVFACDNLDKIVKVLKSKTKTLDEDLAKALKINLDKAKIILAMTVRALSALSKTDIQKRIAEKRALKAQAEKHYKHPNKKILADLPVLEAVLFGKQSKSGK